MCVISDFFTIVREIDLAQACLYPESKGMGDLTDLLWSGEEYLVQPFHDVIILLLGHHLVQIENL